MEAVVCDRSRRLSPPLIQPLCQAAVHLWVDILNVSQHSSNCKLHVPKSILIGCRRKHVWPAIVVLLVAAPGFTIKRKFENGCQIGAHRQRKVDVHGRAARQPCPLAAACTEALRVSTHAMQPVQERSADVKTRSHL